MIVLPIKAHLEEIAKLISEHPVVLLSSPPGTGKTTVLPPYLLSLRSKMHPLRIALLEPRRIAAVRTAEFISNYLAGGDCLGNRVGYRVRGASRINTETQLEVLTYGVFNRIAADSTDLAAFDLVIFDEAHERSIDIDLALAQALEIQASLRPDLKILVMSATLNVDDLLRVVPAAPLVSITAVNYPVEISYLPKSAAEERNNEAHLVRAVRSVDHRNGDILVFLPGASEIMRASTALAQAFPNRNVVELFGDLSLKEQRAILNPSDDEAQRIVLSTAIAETSLTVPRVHTVIDSGFSRVPRFDAERGLPGLTTVRVSSATAEQRAGRSGRLGPGITIRLWPAHEPLVRYRSPEITESDLSPLLLTLASAGISEYRTLKWLTQPSAGAVIGARDLLISLSAIDANFLITAHGAALQRLPLHPRLAHLVLTATAHGDCALGCRLAACWSELRPSEYSSIIDLNELAKRPLDGAARELEKQLLDLVKNLPSLGHNKNLSKLSPSVLFAAAFPDRIAHKRSAGEYLLSGGPRALLTKDSTLAREEWLICPAVRTKVNYVSAQISAASPISLVELREQFPKAFKKTEALIFHSGRKAVINRSAEHLGAIEISAQEFPAASAAATDLLLRSITCKDLKFAARTESLIDRAKWIAANGLISLSTPLSSLQFWETLESPGLPWLLDYIPGVSRLADITEEALHNAVIHLAGGRSVVDTILKLAPNSITLARGRTVPLTYSSGRAPVAASRLQDFFGTKKHPTIANGKVAIICELLSPAGRPVQVTDDLIRFWSGSYAAVRKELKSRYPKHDWPEKP